MLFRGCSTAPLVSCPYEFSWGCEFADYLTMNLQCIFVNKYMCNGSALPMQDRNLISNTNCTTAWGVLLPPAKMWFLEISPWISQYLMNLPIMPGLFFQISFYQPTADRHKILIEDHAFPSDHVSIVCSLINIVHLRLHSGLNCHTEVPFINMN